MLHVNSHFTQQRKVPSEKPPALVIDPIAVSANRNWRIDFIRARARVRKRRDERGRERPTIYTLLCTWCYGARGRKGGGQATRSEAASISPIIPNQTVIRGSRVQLAFLSVLPSRRKGGLLPENKGAILAMGHHRGTSQPSAKRASKAEGKYYG